MNATQDMIGTVSHGTMRAEDLIPAFAWALRAIEGDDGPNASLIAEAETFTGYETEQEDWLLSDLFDALDSHAPEGCYFGAHIGDGCDYGFWYCEE